MKSAFSISFLSILFLLSVVLVSCNDTENISRGSVMVVTEKGYDESKEAYWIQAYNRHEQTEEEADRIFVHDHSLWNLILLHEEYLITAETEESNSWSLTYIDTLSGSSTPSN